ncbi:MAG: WecB/TagA/CpsF family glycosyltransferase [Chloroflexota bacterium]
MIFYVNVHSMNVAAADRVYARTLESADLIYCDGTGVRLGARLAGKDIPERMTGANWIHDLCRLAIRQNYSLFLLGGVPGSAAEAASALQCRHPGVRIAGVLSGYGAGRAAVEAVNRSGADILLVGMGTPTQEEWLAAHADELQPPVLWSVGALFDFVSGRIPRGPRWMTEHGLEWLCRLATEPRKLWRRYLIGIPVFLWRIIRRYRLPP